MGVLKTNTNLSIVEYVAMVEGIASAYFNQSGEYIPHIGRLNAMRLFYNNCVEDTIGNMPHNVIDALQMESIVHDGEFIKAYERALCKNGESFDFSNAYHDAIEIVHTRKSSLGEAIVAMKNAAGEIMNSISLMFTEENLKRIENVANMIADGKISKDVIASAVTDSNNRRKATTV